MYYEVVVWTLLHSAVKLGKIRRFVIDEFAKFYMIFLY